ncbi:AcrR family transcriptional regulator [Mumia flava]|uniref:AcrR family transcriptional regulator n=1 Tax=Mumia flava TaxID=1348852 RepID=A0A2M9B8W8_9ACTN|nr:TetR/AcrR family transcriptional regulator [Mumia flava]PJJ54348.1 AcrR family transcriptional regulator [Mumia flava]
MSTRQAIADAAFRLFGSQGYDSTSVDDIAAAAGVSRSTFFRSYGSKEAVIFPDHETLLSRVEHRLEASSEASAIAAVSDAVRIVLFHYVAEGERARERYRLTTTVPALRERELVSTARYQQLFRRYISRWSDGSETSELRAELMAAAVVAAHNRALRRWLRRETTDPQVAIDSALAEVNRIFEPPGDGTSASAALVVVREGESPAAVEAAVSRALAAWSTGPNGAGRT